MGRGADVLLRQVRDPRLRRRWLVLAGCLALTRVPLVGSLGYENAFVLAPLASLLGMAAGVDTVQGRRARGLPGTLSSLCGQGAAEILVLVAVALGSLLLGTLWQRGCDPLGGLLFFIMGPVTSTVVGWVCGLWAGALVQRRGRALALAFVPMGVCMGVSLARLYAHPVVYAFDPFWGYFSGSVYDEAVSVGRRYLAYRSYNLLGTVAALSLFAALIDPLTLRLGRPAFTLRTTIGVLLAVLATLGTAFIGLRAPQHRFTANAESLGSVLSGTYETEHFVIHYPPRSPEARAIEVVAAEHEFAFHRLEAVMGRAPTTKIDSFIFASPQQKRAWMGAGTVQVAAPWRHQIYLDHRAFPHPVLHHELAHIFGATIGDPVFGVSRSGLRINMGLIEGLATALAPRPADGLDLHDQAQALEALNRRPALASIMGPGFLTQSSRVAYTAAGSFCLWLIEHDGFEPMAVLYRTAGDFERAYDTSLDELEQQWLAFLRARERLRAVDVEAQAQRFERTSVWQRPCAHKVAAIVGEIGHANARVAVEEAVGHYRDLCALEPLSPSHKLGLAAGLGRATQFAEALAVLDEIEAMDALTTTVRAQVHERRGDVALQMGDFARASGAYAQAAESPASEDNLRVVQLKQLGATDPELAPIVVDYFAPFETADDAVVRAVARIHGATKIAGLPRHQALGRYLLGRQLLNVQRADDAIAPLEDSLRPGASVLPTPEFVRAAREALLSAYVEVGRYDDARALLRELRDQPDIGNGHRLEYGFWQERIDFFEAYRTPAG